MTQIKRLSFWAKNHKWSARLLIIAAFILLDIIGIITGLLLSDLNIMFPPVTFYIFVILFFAAISLYPDKTTKGTLYSKQAFYIRQKTCDLILAGSAFLMIVCISNGNLTPETSYISVNAATRNTSALIKDSTLKPYKSIAAFSASMKDENGKMLKWKERKKLLKEQLKGIKKANDISKGGKAALIVLCGLIAIGLLTLVLAWSCSLSCNGSDGAAILVAVGGTVAVIFLVILAGRIIYGRKRKRKNIKEEEKPESENKQ